MSLFSNPPVLARCQELRPHDCLDPSDCGIPKADFDQLKGDDAETNAKIVRDVISGADKGPKTDIVVLNAAAAIIAAGLADDFPSGVALARQAIQNGKAQNALDKLIEISNG